MHIIQAFFSDDESEEVQIQGRTARQGKSGTYSIILADSEVKDLGLDPASLRNMQALACYGALCQARERKRDRFVKEMEAKLKKASTFDSKSHAYLDALLAGNPSLAKDDSRICTSSWVVQPLAQLPRLNTTLYAAMMSLDQ